MMDTRSPQSALRRAREQALHEELSPELETR
jgi:hypothetical protein